MYSARLDKLVASMAAEQLSALLVTSLPNIYYLSGFSGSTAMLLITPGKKYIITDFRYHTQVALEVDPAFELLDNTGKDILRESLPTLGAAQTGSRIGFESDNASYTLGARLAESDFASFIATKGLVENLRMVKDAGELERIREAVLVNERIFQEVLGFVGPDAAEIDLAAEIEYRALKHGCSGVSFSPIVASGPNSAKPHARFSTDKLTPAAPLTFDMGMKLNGYCSDMTRTVFFKDCPPSWEKIYNIVRQAKDSAHAAIRPGLTGREIDAVARDIITEAGYGDKFGHGLGHGVGIEVHEGPRLARIGEIPLAPGHVVTNEPGIYLPGEGGIRIEDMAVVTADGAENFNTLPTDVQVVG
ncbi:aminopeptidase P family protein [bacterium]|nr:aminopeptidase P family protein [bacterium]